MGVWFGGCKYAYKGFEVCLSRLLLEHDEAMSIPVAAFPALTSGYGTDGSTAAPKIDTTPAWITPALPGSTSAQRAQPSGPAPMLQDIW